MKKILTLLCLALALTLICGAAMAEGIAAPTHEHVYDYTDPIYGDLPACGGNEQTKVWFECTDETCTELEFYPLFPLDHVLPSYADGSTITDEQYRALVADGYPVKPGSYTPAYCDRDGSVSFYCKHHSAVAPYKEGGLWKASAACNEYVTYTIKKLAEDGQHTKGEVNEDAEWTYEGVHTTAGQTTYKCAVCSNKTAFVEPEEAPGHIYTKPYTAITNPTCTEPGLVSRQCEYVYPDGTQCNVCDEVVIDKLDHDFPFAAEAVPTVEEVNAVDTTVYTKSNYQAPTCEDVGSVTFKCSRCPVTQENDVKELGHDWDTEENAVIEEEATCIADGRAYLPCKRQGCNARNYVDAPAVPKDTVNGHTWGAPRPIREATCYQFGYEERFCETCQTYKYFKLDKEAHTWDNNGQGVVTKAATCSTKGVRTYTCTVEACKYSKTEDIPEDPTNHDPLKCELVPKDSQAATCTEDGWNTYHCNACGQDFVEVLPHPVGGHNLLYREITAATCTEAGEGVRYCQNCTFSEPANPGKLGHLWTEWDKVDRNANGQVTWFRQCQRCGEAEEFISKDPAYQPHDRDHIWNEGEVTKQPTVTEEGEKTYRCTVDGCLQTKTEKIPKLEPEEPVAPEYDIQGEVTKDSANIAWELTKGEAIPGDLRVNYYIVFEGTGYFHMNTELREGGGNLSIDLQNMNNVLAFTATIYSVSNPEISESFSKSFI